MTIRTHHRRRVLWVAALLSAAIAAGLAPSEGPGRPASASPASDQGVRYRTAAIGELEIFYREAGPPDAPVVLLLHGFPTSSHMFRNLIPALADRYHVIAPDYPGFGNSSMPAVEAFDYTFDSLADVVEALLDHLMVESYSLYLMDYGAPVGFRLATRHPQRVESLVIQNGNAYEAGLREFWDPIKAYWADPSASNRDALRGLLTMEATRWQYIHGARDVEAISPDNWRLDQALLDRPGNDEIQLALFYDYRTNVSLYPSWQEYLRVHQPPVLVVWGANDEIFPPEGAFPYRRDVRNIEFHLLAGGHFLLEERGHLLAQLMRSFLDRFVKS